MIMKKLALLFVLLSSLISFSQLSNKHWIPPLHCRVASNISEQYIYMSTNETTPFQVTATDGSGTPYPGSPFTISATSPRFFYVGTGQGTTSKMFLNLGDVNTPISGKGIILEGPKDFYVSFRMKNAAHAETIISKGKPGIGKLFRLGCLINEVQDNRKNFVASVMATENNTSVTISDYNTGVVFVSGSGNITADTQTFTLNAGQSIVFSGNSDVIANLDGIIGGLITSDKPVAVNTGNALGGIESGRADLTLDQIVSSTQIGTEYIFIAGNGTSAMENPLIVAHENNTAIFVNGSTTAVATLSAGQYYLVPNTYYQGTINKNIYVRASKPVFAYQFLGGGSNTATSGLNFIPPLSCFFQNSVNIPYVNEIGSPSYTSDLMILTYSNATISINGVVVPTTQAQNVLGNTDWVSYRVGSQTGNLNVTSTGPLAVGVFGFLTLSTSVGFAGYYSGFGSTPQDTNVTVCSNDTKDLFSVITGNPGTGGTWTVPSGGSPLNGNIFDPRTNLPGEYIYTFTKTCNTALSTISVKVNVTIQQIKNTGVSTNTSSCLTTPPYDLFSLLGNTAEVGGTWSPTLTSGSGIFNPAVNAGGIYTYSFPATGACPVVSSTVNVNNSAVPIINPISDFSKCDDAIDGSSTNGTATFDLTSKNSEVLGTQTGINVTYYTSQNDANLGQNGITSINTGNRIIYVRLTMAASGCYLTTLFNLVVNPVHTVITQPLATQDSCVGGTIAPFSVTHAGGLGTATIQWFSNSTNSNSGGTAITGATAASFTPPTFNTVDDYYYYAVVTYSGLDCGSVASNTALVHVVTDPTVTITPNTQTICQGTTPADLVVTPSGGVGTFNYQWYSSPANTAITGATNANYTPSTTTVGIQSYYCEITQTGLACSVTSPIVNVQVVTNPSVSSQPLASQPVCINNTPITLTTAFIDGTGTPTYQWYSNTVNSYIGGTLISGATTLIYTPITTVVRTLYYYCIATYTNGNCGTVSTNIAEVIVNPLPVINDITIVQCDDDLDAITAFNLTVNNNQISADAANETFTYYTSLAGASANPTYDEITNPLAFSNINFPNLMYIWTRVTTANGCYRVAKITLRVSAPNIPSSYNITLPTICDDYLDVINNDRDGVASFDLSSTEVTIRTLLSSQQPGINYNIKYYRNRADALAQLNEITNLTNYRNIGYTTTQNLWVRVDSDISNACYGLGPWVTLNVEAKPFAHSVTIPRQCDDNTDGIFIFNTANLESDLLQGQTGVTVTYFDSSNNPLKDSNNNLITSPFPATFSSTSQTIRAVVTNNTPQACWFDTTIQFIVDKSPIDFTIPTSLITACDDETDPTLQNGQFNFTNSQAIHDIVTLGQPTGMTYEYYDENNIRLSTPLPNPLPVTLTKNITIVVYNPINPTCKITKTITFTVNPIPIIELATSKLVCSNNPTFFTLLDAGITAGTPTTNYTYEWYFNGTVIPNETSYTLNVNTEGIYTVKVTNLLGCSKIRTITVIASDVAHFQMPTIMDLSDNNTVIINATGLGNYVYSLDYPNSYQTINIFTDVPAGVHTVYVKDLNGCGTSSQIINVIGIPKFFTPNADGFNDTWNVLGLTTTKNFNTSIYIFDRYGKLLKELSPISKGWDGTFNGEALPTDDYWYTIYFEDGRTAKGHFTLKR
jgi:gliding motility-associated-like protein